MRHIQYMPEVFVPRLTELMKEKKLSKKALCRELRVSHGTVCDWINDTRVMTTVNFFRICEYFNVNPAWLYGLTDNRTTFKE